jgi:hypothetical protein
LNEKYKTQEKDKADVIERLTRDNEEKYKHMLELENKINTLEKRNEKTNNEVVTKFEGQIKDIKKKGDDKMQENEIKMSELKENLNLMDEVDRKKMQHEAELHHWRS